MTRQFVAFLIALYAIGLAFAAMAAMRWPSLIAAISVLTPEASPLAELDGLLDWRELGIWYGAPYMMSAICFYAASMQVQRRRRGGVMTFFLGALSGFPPFLIFQFDAGWWQSPTVFETVIIVAGAFTLFLFGAVWDLRVKDAPARDAVGAPAPAAPVVVALTPKVERSPARKRPAGPLPPAIAMQRASFAYHGRRMRPRRAG
ncbi:MAG: hypothetical protein AAGJ29_12735 [Pseudomonadota bacterium]